MFYLRLLRKAMVVWSPHNIALAMAERPDWNGVPPTNTNPATPCPS
jgi:hypothetical protein